MNVIERTTNKLNDTLCATIAMVQVAIVVRKEEGATAVEYALMVGLIALTIVAGVSVFRNKLSEEFAIYGNTLPG
jgi:pilus assembly protein Flp/PilA